MSDHYPQRIEFSELLGLSGTDASEALTGEPYMENLRLTYELHTSILQAREAILSGAGDSYPGMPYQTFVQDVLPTTGFEVVANNYSHKRHSHALVAAYVAIKALLTADSYYDGTTQTLNNVSVFGSFYDEAPSFEGSTYRALSFKQSSIGPVGPREGTQYEFCTHATEGLVYHVDAYTITNPDAADWTKSSNRAVVLDYISDRRMDPQELPASVRQFMGI